MGDFSERPSHPSELCSLEVSLMVVVVVSACLGGAADALAPHEQSLDRVPGGGSEPPALEGLTATVLQVAPGLWEKLGAWCW